MHNGSSRAKAHESRIFAIGAPFTDGVFVFLAGSLQLAFKGERHNGDNHSGAETDHGSDEWGQEDGSIRDQPLPDRPAPTGRSGGAPRARRGHAPDAALADARAQVHVPGAHGRRPRQAVPRLPGAVQRRARPGQRRPALPSAGDHRHRARPVGLDDLENSGGRYSVWAAARAV